jgi:hypothetical protein
MSYKPDYGLYLLRSGISTEVVHYFSDFRLYSLTILGSDQYSTMVEIPHGGETYALSLDFNKDQLNQILKKANNDIVTVITSELERDPTTPRTIDFEGFVSFAVRARLGRIQTVTRESFVPLVAQEVL